MATAPSFVKARRGDAIVIHTHRRDYVIGQGSTEHDDWEVGVVTGISREGAARKWRPAWVVDGREDYSAPIPAHNALYILPARDFDVPAVIAAARAHSWPSHPDQVRPFGSADEVKAALRHCRLGAAR